LTSRIRRAASAVPPPPVTDMFDHLYETLPLDLAAQREDAIDWESRR
jgi:hypothetical protein